VTRRDPVNRAQRRLDRPPRERFATRELAFDADGDTCRGTLYLPGGDDEDSPVVVMAPGLGAERSFGYPAVAERFADAGYAAFLFDYREFGASDGDSQVVDPAGQRADYAAAIDRVQRVDAIGRELVLGGRVAVGCTRPHARGGAARRRRRDRRGPDARRASDRPAPRREVPRALRGRGRPRPARPPGRSRADRPDRWYHRGVGRDHGRPGTKRKYLDLVDRESTWRATRRPRGPCCGWRAIARSNSSTRSERRHCFWPAPPRRHRRQRGGRRRGRDAVARDRRHHARGPLLPVRRGLRAGSWSSAFLLAGTRSTGGRAATSDEAAAPRSVLSVRRPDTQV